MSVMPSTTVRRATLDDLMKVSGKAELIDGRIVELMPTGYRPNRIARKICFSLDVHTLSTTRGEAFTDNVGFAVPELSSGRESFSPDASYYDGPPPENAMDFIPGPPTFAAEVRSKEDYGPAAERKLAAKRADYFEAGTQVVWDVDPEAECVRSYRRDDPEHPTVFQKGDIADAEPAVPGWRIPVADIFA